MGWKDRVIQMDEEGAPSTVEESKSLWKFILGGGLTASMCCLPAVVWVLFAGSSAIVAADNLSNNLYFSWVRWALYVVALLMVAAGLVIYYRSQGICTLDEAKRQRNRILNTSLMVITATILFYLVFNYVILELIGIAVGLPWEDDAFWN